MLAILKTTQKSRLTPPINTDLSEPNVSDKLWARFDWAKSDGDKNIDLTSIVQAYPAAEFKAKEMAQFFHETVVIVPSVLKALTQSDTTKISAINIRENRVAIIFKTEHAIDLTLNATQYSISTEINMGTKILYSLITEFNAETLRYQQDLSVCALVRHHLDLLFAKEHSFNRRVCHFIEEENA